MTAFPFRVYLIRRWSRRYYNLTAWLESLGVPTRK